MERIISMPYVKEEKSPAALGFQAQIYNLVEELPSKIRWPDKTNQGVMLASLMFWKMVTTLADKKFDALLAELIAAKLLKDPKSIVTPGTFQIGKGGNLVTEVNVSQPRREFSIDWFCAELEKRHGVPQAVTRALFEEAKQPGKTQLRKIVTKEKEGSSIL